MKKLISVIALLIAMLTISGTCSALEKEDLNIDGICLDQNISEVFARYGQPAKIEHGIPVGRVCIYNINGGELRISVTSTDAAGTINGVKITGNTGMATKAGIRVGSTVEEMMNVYGFKPEYQKGRKHDVYVGVDGATDWITYGGDHGIAYFFFLDAVGKIVGIEFGREHSCE